MALAEIARLWNLSEARVAQSALQAAGFRTIVFDENRASALWTEQLAIGGIRLMTGEDQAPEARAFLQAFRTPAEIEQTAPRAAGFFNPRSVLAMVACWVFGWALAGLKLDRGRQVAAILMMVMTAAGLVLLFSYRL